MLHVKAKLRSHLMLYQVKFLLKKICILFITGEVSGHVFNAHFLAGEKERQSTCHEVHF
jgi:hypothetical protein